MLGCLPDPASISLITGSWDMMLDGVLLLAPRVSPGEPSRALPESRCATSSRLLADGQSDALDDVLGGLGRTSLS